MSNREELARLILENPELPVLCMVEFEVVAGDDCNRWAASLGECKIREYTYTEMGYCDSEVIFWREEAEKLVDALAEEIQVAAGFQETDNMLRKSNLLPEGVEKELLKHIGIRMDRYGWAYDFYYDEANDEYFVEILQEGGAKDGIDEDDSANVGHGMPDCGGVDHTDLSDCLPGSSCKKSE